MFVHLNKNLSQLFHHLFTTISHRMATFKAVVQKHHIKDDGTANVKIRLTHNGKVKYIPTSIFVVKQQLNKKLEIKDPEVIDATHEIIKQYRAIILKLGLKVESMDADELKEYISSYTKHSGVDFIPFIDQYIDELIKKGKRDYSRSYVTVRNSLIDFFGERRITTSDITYNFLLKWEAFLRSERTITRMNNKVNRTYVTKPIGDSGLHNHMRDLRTLFREAQRRFNDDEKGDILIPHYPFNKYRLGSAPVTQHRDLSIEEIKLIRATEVEPNSREELARDLFMLSFYLLGMNAADIYELKIPIKGRIEYHRAKTKERRKDKALISIKVVPEATPLLKRYIKEIHERYSLKSSLLTAIHKGLKKISERTGIADLDFYSARHSVATIARRNLGFSKDEVSEILNHVRNSTTDIYIAQDWSLHDKVQAGLIELLNKESLRQQPEA